MLAFTARTLFRQRERERNRPARPTGAGRRLDRGLDQRPKVRKKSAFENIFKEDITGIDTLAADRRQRLFRYGAYHDIDPTVPALRHWLRRWMRRGGVALL